MKKLMLFALTVGATSTYAACPANSDTTLNFETTQSNIRRKVVAQLVPNAADSSMLDLQLRVYAANDTACANALPLPNENNRRMSVVSNIGLAPQMYSTGLIETSLRTVDGANGERTLQVMVGGRSGPAHAEQQMYNFSYRPNSINRDPSRPYNATTNSLPGGWYSSGYDRSVYVLFPEDEANADVRVCSLNYLTGRYRRMQRVDGILKYVEPSAGEQMSRIEGYTSRVKASSVNMASFEQTPQCALSESETAQIYYDYNSPQRPTVCSLEAPPSGFPASITLSPEQFSQGSGVIASGANKLVFQVSGEGDGVDFIVPQVRDNVFLWCGQDFCYENQNRRFDKNLVEIQETLVTTAQIPQWVVQVQALQSVRAKVYIPNGNLRSYNCNNGDPVRPAANVSQESGLKEAPTPPTGNSGSPVHNQ